MGLERGPLSLVSKTMELLGIKSSGCKSWQYLRRQAAVARSVYFARGLRPLSLVHTSHLDYRLS
jgi:hypothetical protein